MKRSLQLDSQEQKRADKNLLRLVDEHKEESDEDLQTIVEIITEDDDMLNALIGVHPMRYALKEKIRTEPQRGLRIMHQLMYGSDAQCLHSLRMGKSMFHRLLSKLKEYGLQECHRVSTEVALGMSLKILGHNISQRVVAADFQISQWTVTSKFDEVLSALCRLHTENVSWKREDFVELASKIRHDRRYFPYFRDCIGALDGTHIPVLATGKDKITYWNRKEYASMNILAVCNFDMKFIYTRIGVPGRAHDTKVLTECARHDEFFPFPESRKYFLVDSGYPNRKGFMAPYQGEPYHPNHFSGRRPRTMREMFNKRHSSLRSVIERTFGVWKGKWTILKGPPRYSIKVQEKIVAATMALHNFIRDCREEDIDFNVAEVNEDYIPDTAGDTSTSLDDILIDRFYDATADLYMANVRDGIANEIWNAEN